MKDLFRALKYFRAEAARVVGVFGLMLVSVGLNVLKPWPVAVLIDSVLGQKPWPGHRDPILAGAKPLMAFFISRKEVFRRRKITAPSKRACAASRDCDRNCSRAFYGFRCDFIRARAPGI
jgi:hypothetical protein